MSKGFDWGGFLQSDPSSADPLVLPSAFGKLLLAVDDATGALSLIGAEPALGNPASDGYRLTSTAAGVRSWAAPIEGLPSQTGHSGQFLTTNGSAASWAAITAPAWGAISGTLASQTDLQSALDAKQALDSDLTAIAALTTTSYGRSFLDRADAAAGRTLLGLGSLATQSGTFSGTSSGSNTGDQTISLTGDVTGSGTGSFAATIANSAVTLAKMANMATASLIYRKTAGSGAPEVNSLATLKTDLGLTGTNSGDQDLSGYQTKAGVLALGGFSSITGRVGNANLPLGAQLYDNAGTPLLSVDVSARKLWGAISTVPKAMIDWSADGTIKLLDGILEFNTGGEMHYYGGAGPTWDLDGLIIALGGGSIGAYNYYGNGSLVGKDVAGVWRWQSDDGTQYFNNTGFHGSAANLTNFPTLNQNTTGSAASLSISGQTGKLTAIGLTSTDRAKTFRNADDTILELGGSYTPTGTWTNLTLVTPALGTPSALVLTNATGSPTGISLTKAQLNTIVSDDDPAYLGTVNTFTAAQINSVNGAASTPAMKYSGTPFAGTGTTSFPLFYLNDSTATASTTLSTSGTYLGVNGHGSADLANFLLDGTTKFKVTSGGNLTTGGNISTGASGVLTAGSGEVDFGASSLIYAPSAGILRMSNLAGTSFTGLDFRSDNNSGFRIGFAAVNGIDLQSGAGTTTWNDSSTAASGTVANRYLFGIAAPTLTATNSSVTDTVASTFYIGGAPTGSTNTTITTPYALNVASGVSNFGGPFVVAAAYTVATLPSTAATGKVTGSQATVTDGDASLAWGATVINSGAGATKYLVWYNGTNWTVMGK